MSTDQTTPRRNFATLNFLSRHSLLQLVLGTLLMTLALRAALHTVQLNDVLARILASLAFFAIPVFRFALPGGLDAASADIRRGWEHSMRWLALVGWWRLFFFSILVYTGMYCSLHAAFLHYSHEMAFSGIIFGLLAIAVASRIHIPAATPTPDATPATDARQTATAAGRPAIGTSGIALIIAVILVAMAIGFAAGWTSHFVMRESFSITDKGITIRSPDGSSHSIGSDAAGDEDSTDTSPDDSTDKDVDIRQPDGGRVQIHKSADGRSRDVQITDGEGKSLVSIHKQAATGSASGPVAAQSAPQTRAKPAKRAHIDSDTEDDEDNSGEMYLAFLLFLVIGKILARDKYRAELNAASAWSVADRSMLDREIADAKLAAMQAQIEPHFLFNTLASIDQLIQSDPPRASRLQKSLIQYLRAAIPQIRSDAHRSTLGRQVDMSLAYLEIMQMRMEERLHYEIHVADSLRGAEFPSMMLQTLIENAIKHGLEPAPEGGRLIVTATRDDKCLTLNVSNTGVSYTPSQKPGSGTGLTNIRDRLRLLYGDRGAFTIGAPASGGCLAVISIPYTTQP